eukprot:SAG11_NODE_2364_length_3458_cov_1.827032_2_plen_55_part_00
MVKQIEWMGLNLFYSVADAVAAAGAPSLQEPRPESTATAVRANLSPSLCATVKL